jgi:hypothetical protein
LFLAFLFPLGAPGLGNLLFHLSKCFHDLTLAGFSFNSLAISDGFIFPLFFRYISKAFSLFGFFNLAI